MFWIVMLFTSLLSYAQSPTLADAQKAYLASNWVEAAQFFDTVCPQLEEAKKAECHLWTLLSLSQTGRVEDFSKAIKKLDSLIQVTSPRDPIYTDLYMTKAQFELYLNKFNLSVASLKHAVETSKASQYPVLLKVCQAIEKAYPKPEVQEICAQLRAPNSTANASSSFEMPLLSSSTSISSSSSSSSLSSSSSSSLSSGSNKNGWVLQLGAFSLKENASLLADNLKKRNISSQIREKHISERTLYLVQSKAFESEEAANEYGEKVFTPLNMEFRALKSE